MKRLILILIVILLLVGCANQDITIKLQTDDIVNNDEKTKEKVDLVLQKIEQMSLEDKIEQMLIIDYSLVAYGKDGSATPTKLSESAKNIIQNHNFGGIILFADNTKGTRQTAELVNDFQRAASIENNRQQIPLFMAIDQEGGRVNRLATGTSMPGNMALGAIDNYETTKEYASIIGEELGALGFNVDFAPVLDVNNNPLNPIIGVRSFSSNPQKVANMGKAFIEGLHSNNIASTFKHFPGHGDTATDSHTGLPLIDKSYEEIKNLELIPFEAGIKQGVDMIMTAHIVYPQIEKEKYISKKTGEEITLPATLSKTILTDILRKDMGYNGIIVTDALNMSAIKDHFKQEDVAKLAINAGVDILLMPTSIYGSDNDINAYVQMIVGLVQNGEIAEERINESVARILKLKQKMGLLEKTDFILTEEKIEKALQVVGSKEHHEKELQIAKAAITQTKGEELLPLNKSERVLFLVSNTNQKNNIIYAIEKLKEQELLDETFEYDMASINDISKITNASVVVILSDTTKATSINQNEPQSAISKAINETHKQNKKVVLVSCMLPYDIAKYEDADVILLAYGNRTIDSLPIEYDGETITFGVNITAAIMRLFENKEFTATLPVN